MNIHELLLVVVGGGGIVYAVIWVYLYTLTLGECTSVFTISCAGTFTISNTALEKIPV